MIKFLIAGGKPLRQDDGHSQFQRFRLQRLNEQQFKWQKEAREERK